jgi:hypothetical protein
MRLNVIIPGLLLVTATIGGAAILHAIEPKPAAAAAVSKAPTKEGPKIATGEASRATRGNLAVYLPSEIAIRQQNGEPTFDLVIHFHGAAKNQEYNVDEAKLPAVIVSVNEGIASDSYGKAWSAPKAIDRVVKFAEDEVGKQRESGAKVGRIALSSWSAGGASVKNILQHSGDSDGDRIDAVILADGVFSYWEDSKKQVVKREPLDPIINFGKKALNGEKLMIITHTAIATDYPNVETCTKVVLDALDLQKGEAAPLTQPQGGSPTYAVDRGGFHVRGVDGKGPEDHIAQIRSLDDSYSELRRRWYP